MKTLALTGWDQHRVRCDACGHDQIHDDVGDAINDYTDHVCEVKR